MTAESLIKLSSLIRKTLCLIAAVAPCCPRLITATSANYLALVRALVDRINCIMFIIPSGRLGLVGVVGVIGEVHQTVES